MKNSQKIDPEKPVTSPKEIVDTAIQTDGIDKSDESCQTESSERKDFQVQVQLQEQGESIATQTDITAQCDFQVQANIPRYSDSIATQTIKEEIRMPNIPSSVGQTPAKKRKLSPMSTSSAVSPNVSIDVSLPPEPLPNGSGDHVSNEQAAIEPSDTPNGNGYQSMDEQVVLDDEILNSEVYQIYCRNEDPKEAMKQIRKLKSFVAYWESTKPFPTEEDFKRTCETALDRLWNLKPHLGESKFDKIKEFADRAISFSQLSKSDDTLNILSLFKVNEYFTQIRLLRPMGYEFWIIANFEQGPRKSK